MSAEKLSTEIRQEQIAQAALDIVRTEGLRGLNLAALARRVGIVPSGIYRHFKDKDEVIDAILTLIGKRLVQNVSVARGESSDALDTLRRLLMRHVQMVRENAGIPRVIFSEEVYAGAPGRRKRVQKIILGYLAQVGEILKEGQRAGLVRKDVPTDTLAVMFLGLIQPGAILWHLSDGGFDVTKQAERTWRLYAAAIRPDGAQ